MDMLDQALESGQDKSNDSGDDVTITQTEEGSEEQAAAIASVNQAGITLDPSVQYQFRTDGQVTYRVVQVAGEDTAQVVTTNAFPPGTQVAQAVIQSPFSNGGSPSPQEALTNQGEARFTYVPAVSAGGDAQPAEVNNASASIGQATLGQVQTAGGQFYVMMSPQDVLQGQRTIAPRAAGISPRIEGTRSNRDDRRRATHNEVERKRRDKINNWIVQLSKLLPDTTIDHSKQGQSKGGILAKACEYIQEIGRQNQQMADSLKETERLSVDAELSRQQCEELKQENAMLRAQLQQHGIVPPDLSGTTS